MALPSQTRATFGDFQTPPQLAAEVCAVAQERFGVPAVVVEPSCGVGGFLLAAYQRFGARPHLHGVELRRDYLQQAEKTLVDAGSTHHRLVHANLFEVNWRALLAHQKTPVLLLGNPPWVTNAAQGASGGTNLPPKQRTSGGLAALTGESNFDISQWLVTRLFEAAAGREVGFALLLKVAVVRRLLADAWESDLPLRALAIYKIDAQSQFQASVDACLFVGRCDRPGKKHCPVHASLASPEPCGVIGYDGTSLVADINAYTQTRHLLAPAEEQPSWRSGIKHDCAKVFELQRVGEGFQNGLGERVEVESAYLYPLLKSSDVARGRDPGARWLIVPQRRVGESTAQLETTAPKLWRYLQSHAERVDNRRSRIYRGRPRFSIFGVGSYTFSAWKLAISGLYKQLKFRCLGPFEGKPVVFDDTVYMLECSGEAEARAFCQRLGQDEAVRFFRGQIFWDAKRPITAKILRRLNLQRLADTASLGCAPELLTDVEGPALHIGQG